MSLPQLILHSLTHPLATTKGDRLTIAEADQNFIELVEAITNPGIRLVNTNDAILETDCIIMVDTTLTPVTLTLPTGLARNFQVQIYDIGGFASNNPITLVDTLGGNLINGQSSFDIDLNWGFAWLTKGLTLPNWYALSVTSNNVCCGGDPCASGPFEFAAIPNVALLQFVEGVAQDYTVSLLVDRTCCPGPITVATNVVGLTEITTLSPADFSGNTVSITVSSSALVTGPQTGSIEITLSGCSTPFTQVITIPVEVLDSTTPDFVVEPIMQLQVEVNNSVVGNTDIVRVGGCADDINVIANSVPTGITIAPFTIPAISSTAPFTVVADSTAIPGVYTVTLEYSGCSQVKSQDFTLEILPENLLPDFLIDPILDLSVIEGENVSVPLVVSRINGCADVLTVSAVTPLPAGVTINPFTLPGNSTNFLIQTDISAIPGIYGITLRVIGCGQDKTVTFNLEVLPIPAANLVITPSPASLTFPLGQLNTSRVVFDITRTNCPLPVEVSYISSKGGTSTIIVNGITQVPGNTLEVEIVSPDYSPLGSETLTFTFEACGVTVNVDLPIEIIDPCDGVTPEISLSANYDQLVFTQGEDEVIPLEIILERVCCSGPITLELDPSVIDQYKGQTAQLTNGIIVSSKELFGSGTGIIEGDRLILAIYNSNLHPPIPGTLDLILTATSDCTNPVTVAQITIPIQVLV